MTSQLELNKNKKESDMVADSNGRRGRRNGDNNMDTRRGIDPIHMENFILVVAKLASIEIALEALLTREMTGMQQALDNLKKGD